MSRSRKKYYKSQYVCGNDRPRKIEGRRNLRSANKRTLKNLLTHKDINTVNDEIYNIRRVHAMDPWGWPSDASAHCFYGTKEQFLKMCENKWTQHHLVRTSYKSKTEYMNQCKRDFRRGINK